MTSLGALGDNLCSGANWTDNGDGTFTTGATDNVLELDFMAADGTITWTILDDDGTVTPVGYVEPTEFEETPVKDDGGVPSGIYTYKEDNGFMDIEWELELRDDGSYALTEVGRDTYMGESYTQDGDTIVCGPMLNAPLLFTWANPEGFTVTVDGSTFAPVE